MKKLLLIGTMAIVCGKVLPQSIPDLPVALGVGSAEVRGDYIYFFGGATTWSGGTRFSTIYRYDGQNWQNYDETPDNDMFGISTTIKGDSAFVYGGYSFGNNKLRIYNFVTGIWDYLTESPNISATYGHSIEYHNGKIYLFFNGYVYIYNISTETWSQGATNETGASWLTTVVYQDEIYPAGWTNGAFYKYSPASDQWTKLADLPYHVSGGALKCIDSRLYYVGGTSGPGGGTFNNTLVYDINSDQWSDANIYISSDRAYMGAVIYKERFYVLGGLDRNASAVSNSEYIAGGFPTAIEIPYSEPEDFILPQIFPNPFNRSSTIRYTVSYDTPGSFGESPVTIKIVDAMGKEVVTLINEYKPAGTYDIHFDASALPAGIYICRFRAGSFTASQLLQCIR